MKHLMDPFRVVLVSPLYAGNVGAVVRVTGNFATNNLVVVNPQCDIHSNEAMKYACRLGQKRLAELPVYSSLTDAVKDCHVVIGFTGKLHEKTHNVIELSQIPALAKTKQRIALVFGREDNGLHNEEFLQCTHLCTIPTHEESPSLNVSHAVCVVLAHIYHTYLAEHQKHNSKNATPVPTYSTASSEHCSLWELEQLFAHWRQVMIRIGLTKAGNPDRMLHVLQKIFQRAHLSTQEYSAFRGFLSQIEKHLPSQEKHEIPS